VIKFIITGLLTVIISAFFSADVFAVSPNSPTPSGYIFKDTFPVGSWQVIDYANTLIVRTGPSNDYRILTFVNRGDEFIIHDYQRRFVQIETDKGLGWIFAGFLSRQNAAPESEVRILEVLESISSANWRDMWVESAFHYSPVIDSNVVFPVGFWIRPYNHHYDTGEIWGITRGAVPIAPAGFQIGGFSTWTMKITMRELEPEIMELRYDTTRPITYTDHGDIWEETWSERSISNFSNRRIVIDTRINPVQTFRYYIDETVRDMVRLDESRDPSRYTVEAVDGGIRLAWHLPAWSIWKENGPQRLYRSDVRGERGELVLENDFGSHYWNATGNGWLYEFIDTTVSDNVTYYYSLWMNGWMDEGEYSVPVGGEWQMTVRLPLE